MKGKKLITLMRSGVLGMSKPVMIGVVVVCLILAVVIFFFSGGDDQGAYETLEGNMIWVKCNNPDCNAEYQMDEAEYRRLETEARKSNIMYPGAMPITCKECGQQSLLEAIKCPNPDCGKVFFRGELGAGHFQDECPHCGYSATKEKRRKAAGGS